MYGTVTINVLANENVRSKKSLYGLDRISLWGTRTVQVRPVLPVPGITTAKQMRQKVTGQTTINQKITEQRVFSI